MLVATLACELAPRALRVNAIEAGPGLEPGELEPLLRFVAGARAQFFTGQTLRAHRARGL
jgi:NAD(P)-dependent dehydrogenase (short-subunit alcohol dehydrogenase family)